MNKLIAVLLSISLVFGSVTPSLAQANKLVKGATGAFQQTGKELVGGAGQLPNTMKQAAGTAAASTVRNVAGVRVPQVPASVQVSGVNAGNVAAAKAPLAPELKTRLSEEITQQAVTRRLQPKSLTEINKMLERADFSEKDAKAVYDQIFNVPSRTSSAKEFLLLNVLPSVSVKRGFAIGEIQADQALQFYRRTLIALQDDLAKIPSSSSLEELLQDASNQEVLQAWSKAMAAVSNIGFFSVPQKSNPGMGYVAPKDAQLLVTTYENVPEVLKPITKLVVSRSLLAMKAEVEMDKIYRGQYDESNVVSLFTNKQTADKMGKLLGSWNELNVIHLNPSSESTVEWLELNAKKGKVIAAPEPLVSQPAVVSAAVRAPLAAPKLEVDLSKLTVANNLSVGAVSVPASAAEETVASIAENTAEAAASGSWISRGLNRIKSAFTPAEKPQNASGSSLINDAALSRALGMNKSGTLSMGGLGGLTDKANNTKLLKRIHKTLENAKSEVDVEFIALAKKAQQEGTPLTSADYDKLLSERMSASVKKNPRLAQYSKEIEQVLAEEQAVVPAKRELSFSLKMHDAEGKVLPVTFELNVRLLDNTAVRQFERLGVTNSEVFTLMRDSKDGKPTGPFELMLTTPGGGKRPIYEPFIEGGKAGVEALYYRLLGDYQAGKLASNKVSLNLYSDVYAERATMYAGLTEGLGGLPQATVAPQATALGISDPKALQEGVSHSQLGNVASVFFSGLQKEFGIKNTLALGLGVAALGLGICGFGLSLPSLAAKIFTLGAGSFVLGVGANGGVKSTNSIFAKEMSNDNTSGTARMGFVNARASIGTMTGYLFFPVSVLFALSGVEAFQWLYYGATAVPAYAFINLLLSKVRNVGAKHGDTSTWANKLKVVGKSSVGILKNIWNNVKFAVSGGYQERLAALREKRFVKERTKQYEDLLKGNTAPLQETEKASNSLWAKAKDFMTVKVPAATSQYMLRMMTLVGLYHFAGMMYNSGPGAIIGSFIKSEEGASLVDMAQNMPMPVTALLAGASGYALTKIGQKLYASLSKKFSRGPSEEMAKGEQPDTATEKAGAFTKKHLPWLVGGATTAATALSPEAYEVAHSIFSRFDPTSVAQIATFLTAYVGVWAGRQYLAKYVKSGKLTPQGIIGASGVLSTLAVGLAFIPAFPLLVKAILWGIAGLGFANLAGFENSLAMEKYPNQKPAVNMAYTLARLSGALTVLYGSLTTTFAKMGIPNPDINALVLPAGALALATLINGKYFTHNFIQDVKRWRGLPPTLSYKLLRTESDAFYKKYLETDHSVEYWAQDAKRIAADLFQKTRHDLAQIERVMKPIHEKLHLNKLRLSVINELKELLNGAAQNNVPLGMEELTYKDLRTREIQPLLNSLSGKTLTPEQEAKVVHSVAGVIYNRYFIKAESLAEMERGVMERNEGLDEFRLEVLRNMYKMELTKIAKDRVARYKGNRPSYDRAMEELNDMANKVLGAGHDWKAPAFEE